MAGIDISGLKKGLETFETKAQFAIKKYAETSAIKVQAHMQDKAPWTDRSGDARKRLKCQAYPIPSGYVLILAHGVDYGIWLELANEKNYAIIKPALDKMGPEIMSGFDKLLERLER